MKRKTACLTRSFLSAFNDRTTCLRICFGKELRLQAVSTIFSSRMSFTVLSLSI